MLIRKSRALFSRFYKSTKLIADIVNAILSHPKRYRAILATFITFPKAFFFTFSQNFFVLPQEVLFALLLAQTQQI